MGVKVNKKFRKYAVALLSLVGIGLLYQNCSNVNLTKLPLPLQNLKSQGAFCSALDTSADDVMNVIFIVDMSGSNLNIGTAPGTDRPGLRFDVIENFIKDPCINKNPNNKFTVIGFSADRFGGTCSKTNLVNPANALAQLDSLRLIQETDLNDPTPANMTSTNYSKGLQCAESIMKSHVASLPSAEKSKNIYLSYFLTDGLSTDVDISNSTYVADTKALLEPQLNSMSDVGNNQAGGFQLQPILYGEDKIPNAAVNLPKAYSILEFMAEKGDSFRVSVANVNEIKLCDLLSSGKRTKYTVKEVGVINLNALMSKGMVVADSDMDGLSDEEEMKRGFDPQRARSRVQGNELLDGLCPAGAPASGCPLSINCGLPNELGLTKCDLAAHGLTDGLDSDADYIPDYVEILKGSSANTYDRMNNVDGDSWPLYREIAFGRDPKYPDDNVPSNYLLSYTHQLLQQPLEGCPLNQESWYFRVDNLPLIPTYPTIVDDNIGLKSPFLMHEENENVIFVYYIVRKANENENLPSTAILYGQFVNISLNNPVLNLGEFKKLGDIDGIFKTVP